MWEKSQPEVTLTRLGMPPSPAPPTTASRTAYTQRARQPPRTAISLCLPSGKAERRELWFCPLWFLAPPGRRFSAASQRCNYFSSQVENQVRSLELKVAELKLSTEYRKKQIEFITGRRRVTQYRHPAPRVGTESGAETNSYHSWDTKFSSRDT